MLLHMIKFGWTIIYFEVFNFQITVCILNHISVPDFVRVKLTIIQLFIIDLDKQKISS